EPSQPKPFALESEWTRFRIRSESLYLRTLRAGDHAALLRLTSRTLRGALEEVGVDKDRIEEHVTTTGATNRLNGAASRGSSVNTSAPPFASTPPIQWHIEVPRRAAP